MADSLFNSVYNPDVLSCLANLSNDEVFTPPEVVNSMLDMLPEELFRNPDTKFLDPACKTGVFLREIAKRLIKGLEWQIPDLQERIDHIFHNQLYGIAITELTSLLSRRGVYCSKYPNSEFSVTRFDNAEGNIRYKRIPHTWKNGKCIYCGASADQYERGDELETHAYELIHTTKPEDIFKMKFDVIIGNPPYQLSTASGVEAQATPIYDKFIEQSMLLQPRYLTMIIPSRWMNGGFGLGAFREKMLNNKHIAVLHDYLNANDCFPGVSITGGICYFLHDKSYQGDCEVYTHRDDGGVVYSKRPLLEEGMDTFIRMPEAITILKKVQSSAEDSFYNIVSQRDPFGLNYYEVAENGKKIERVFKKYTGEKAKDDVKIYVQNWQKDGASYADKKYITENQNAVGKYKVYISKANGAASNKAPYAVLSKPFIGEPNSICGMTYLMIGPFETYGISSNVITYIQTKFFRFLVSMMKNTQGAYRQVYSFVPMQDFSKPWTDEELYAKYNLTQEEIDFIESMIKPMDLNGGDENG